MRILVAWGSVVTGSAVMRGLVHMYIAASVNILKYPSFMKLIEDAAFSSGYGFCRVDICHLQRILEMTNLYRFGPVIYLSIKKIGLYFKNCLALREINYYLQLLCVFKYRINNSIKLSFIKNKCKSILLI